MESIGIDLCVELLEAIYLGQQLPVAFETFSLQFAEGTERIEGGKVVSRKGLAALPGAEPVIAHDVELAGGTTLRLWLRQSPESIAKAIRMLRLLDQLVGHVEHMHNVAVSDALTGILNRRGLEEWFANRTARYLDQAPCTVAFFDLDRFKELNDRHGHEKGDQALKDIALALKSSLGEQDIVARLGGDEFVVILEETVYSRVAARRIEDLIRLLPLRRYALTVTVGVAGYPQHGKSLEEVLRAADEVLYVGKRRGKNRVLLVEDGVGQEVECVGLKQ